MSRCVLFGAGMLLGITGCGAKEAFMEEPRQSCGGVIGVPACLEPTTYDGKGCTLRSEDLRGNCVPGFDLINGSCSPSSPSSPSEPLPTEGDASAAQGTTQEPSVEVRREARALLDASHRLCSVPNAPKQDLDEARRMLEEALRLFPHPVLWQELARCETASGHALASVIALRRALDAETRAPKPNAERENAAKARLVELEPLIARLRVDLGEGLEDARVAIDRAPFRPEALAEGIEIDSGEHELAASAKGRSPQTERPRLEPGQTFLWHPTLAPDPEWGKELRP